MNQPSIIASVLEAEVKRELRQRGIVVWLDKDSYYNTYIDELIERYSRGEFYAPVVAFRGSYLEMLFALEPYANGLDPEPLLIHMPGHTEETIRKTPILELYHAGYRYRKALETLIREAATGHVSPDNIENYLKNNVTDLASAETWLQNAISQPQTGLAAYLENLSLEWLLDGLLDLDGIIDEGKKLRGKITNPTDFDILAEHLYRHTGINKAFLDFYLNHEPLSFSSLGEVLTAWLMCVEYVHDLTRPPYLEALQPLTQISTPLKKTCKQLVEHLRQRYPDTYENKALITETHLEREFNHISPEDLGQIDTFQREETAVLDAALVALLAGEFEKALQWSKSRIDSDSFWLGRDRTRRQEWSLIQDAATLGCKIKDAGRMINLRTHTEALEYYTQSGYQVDKAHRRFEQQRFKLLESTLPHFAQLLEATDILRRQYRLWADNLALDFSSICTTEGFLAEDNLQQRTLYEQIVHPLTQSNKKVAYFLIDALRYEMATELLQDLQDAGIVLSLKARYAELPSITSVGMNVLAPVSQRGKLLLAGGEGFKGFKTGEYTVRSPDERVRAMGDKSIDNVTKGRRGVRRLNLADVCNYSTSKLKQSCSTASLIVVHGKEIDDAGEANVGLATFETWLQQIKAACNHLKNIGINEFIFTADHGFLLLDDTTQEKPYGSKRDPNRRYILSAEPRSEQGMVTVSLDSLKYEGQDGYLLFRKDNLRETLGGIAQDASQIAQGKKSLFFCESRALAEDIAERMRNRGTDVFVHHSSVSLEERTAAEERFQRGTNTSIICTSTLELGIDVGDLDLVFQANAPSTVSSFLQRLGRTGRRANQQANTTFFCENIETVLQAIAIIELARKGWVEPIPTQTRAWAVLVHQLLALTLQFGAISPERCWEQLSVVPDFSGISHTEFEVLIKHMIKEDFLYQASGLLSMGDKAEKVFGRKNFMELYAVFSSPQLYKVQTPTGYTIGSLEQLFVDKLVADISSFLLSGKAWIVKHINHQERTVLVAPAPRGKKPSWGGFAPQILSFKLCQQIAEILKSSENIPYIDDKAAPALNESRSNIKSFINNPQNNIQIETERTQWWTFAGGQINHTLKYGLQFHHDWKITSDNFKLKIEGDSVGAATLSLAITKMSESTFWENSNTQNFILSQLPEYRLSKFQRALPAFYSLEIISNYLLDIKGAISFLNQI